MLLNVNEFQPQFKNRMYEVTVSESIRIGDVITTLSAHDEDLDDTLVYTIYSAVNNQTYSLFGINHQTGNIY